MAQPNEQDKFSIDEIIDRLKNPPNEEPMKEGKLVTRDDGTQVIRVRKRKRRSHQPQKDEFKKKWLSRMLQISALVIFVLVALSIVGSAIVYANSAPYREKILRIIGNSSGGKVRLEQFRVNPAQAVAGQLALEWPEGNILRELSVKMLAADISPTSFLGKTLTGDEANSQQGTLALGLPQAGAPRRHVPAIEPPLPVRFNRYAVQKLQVRFGNSSKPAGWFSDTEVSLQPHGATGRPMLLINGGMINFRAWPKTRLDRSHIEFREDEIDVIGMRLMHESDQRGTMDLQGSVTPYEPDRPNILSVRMDSFLISGIAGPESERLMTGRINTVPTPGSNQLSFHCRPDPSTTLSVNFQNSSFWPLEIHGFAFLGNLAKTLEDNWFERPVFEAGASGILTKTEEGTSFEGLSFENKERMAVRGDLKIGTDRRLSGTLRIGIAEAMVKTASNRRLDQMAGPTEEGYRWFSVKIGGHINAPTDDFLQLLQASKAPESPAKPTGVPSFEQLTVPE